MEEARQHSALERRLFVLGVLYAAGLLAIIAGLVLQFTIGGRAAYFGLLGFIIARAAIAGWQLVSPSAFGRERSWQMTLVAAIFWLGIAFAVSMPLLV